MVSLDSLPMEMIRLIIDQVDIPSLPRLSLVNRSLGTAATDRLQKTFVRFNIFETGPDTDFANFASSPLLPMLHRLDLVIWTDAVASNRTLHDGANMAAAISRHARLARMLAALQHLRLAVIDRYIGGRCPGEPRPSKTTRPHGLTHLLGAMHALTSLTLSGLRDGNTKLDPRLLGPRFASLTRLHLQHLRVRGPAFTAFAQAHAPTLRSLVLRFVRLSGADGEWHRAIRCLGSLRRLECLAVVRDRRPEASGPQVSRARARRYVPCPCDLEFVMSELLNGAMLESDCERKPEADCEDASGGGWAVGGCGNADGIGSGRQSRMWTKVAARVVEPSSEETVWFDETIVWQRDLGVADADAATAQQ